MKSTRRIAVSGVLAALSVVIMYIASVTELLSLCGMLVSVFSVMFIYMEYGAGNAFTVYGVISVISLLIQPDKFTAVLFTVYVGYYPLLKAKLEGKFRRTTARILKLLSFNFVLVLLIALSKYVTAIEAEAPAIEISVFILANISFIMSDLLADRLKRLYLIKYRPRLKARGVI